MITKILCERTIAAWHVKHDLIGVVFEQCTHTYVQANIRRRPGKPWKYSLWAVGLSRWAGAGKNESFTFIHPPLYYGSVLLCTCVFTFIIKTSPHFCLEKRVQAVWLLIGQISLLCAFYFWTKLPPQSVLLEWVILVCGVTGLVFREHSACTLSWREESPCSASGLTSPLSQALGLTPRPHSVLCTLGLRPHHIHQACMCLPKGKRLPFSVPWPRISWE